MTLNIQKHQIVDLISMPIETSDIESIANAKKLFTSCLNERN